MEHRGWEQRQVCRVIWQLLDRSSQVITIRNPQPWLLVDPVRMPRTTLILCATNTYLLLSDLPEAQHLDLHKVSTRAMLGAYIRIVIL